MRLTEQVITMYLTELYKKLGQMINIREDIRREIATVKSNSLTGRRQDRINSLQCEYDRVQQLVIEIDREIREREHSRAAVR